MPLDLILHTTLLSIVLCSLFIWLVLPLKEDLRHGRTEANGFTHKRWLYRRNKQPYRFWGMIGFSLLDVSAKSLEYKWLAV